MGTEYYLINVEKKQAYELGKGLFLVFDAILVDFKNKRTTRERAVEDLARRFKQMNATFTYAYCFQYAKDVIDDIDSTLGFYGCVVIGDDDDRIWNDWKDFILVGTRYGDKSDVGKTLKSGT